MEAADLQLALPVLSVDQVVELLFFAMRNCDQIDTIKFIVEYHRPDVNVYRQAWGTPLIFAVANINLELVKYLISIGADVNLTTPDPTGPNTAFKMALHKGYQCAEIAQYLLEMNADHTPLVDADQNNALLKAFMTGNWKIVSYMLNNKKYCNPKAKNIRGENVEKMIDYLCSRTGLPEDLPLALYDSATWVGQNPTLVGVIIQWTYGPPT